MNISLILKNRLCLFLFFCIPLISGYAEIQKLELINTYLNDFKIKLSLVPETNGVIFIKPTEELSGETLVREFYHFFAILNYLNLTEGISEAFNGIERILLFKKSDDNEESVYNIKTEFLELITNLEEQDSLLGHIKVLSMNNFKKLTKENQAAEILE